MPKTEPDIIPATYVYVTKECFNDAARDDDNNSPLTVAMRLAGFRMPKTYTGFPPVAEWFTDSYPAAKDKIKQPLAATAVQVLDMFNKYGTVVLGRLIIPDDRSEHITFEETP